jgi:hypothetical protein
MNQQVINYINSLIRIHGTEQEVNLTHFGFGSGKRHNKVDNSDTSKLDSMCAKRFGGRLFQKWLNNQLGHKYQIQLNKLEQLPGWPNPPLDFCDAKGKIICYIKYTNYELESLDTRVMSGIAFPEWIRENLQLATGRDGLPGEQYFKYAFMLYVDQMGDCVLMGVKRAGSAINGTFFVEQTTQAHVHFGSIQSAEEYRQGIKFDYNAAWFFPYNYWIYIGRIPEEEMIQFPTSWAAKQTVKYPDRPIIYPNQKPVYQFGSNSHDNVSNRVIYLD